MVSKGKILRHYVICACPKQNSMEAICRSGVLASLSGVLASLSGVLASLSGVLASLSGVLASLSVFRTKLDL